MKGEFLSEENETNDEQNNLDDPSNDILHRRSQNRFQIMVYDNGDAAHPSRNQIKREQESNRSRGQNNAPDGNERDVFKKLFDFGLIPLLFEHRHFWPPSLDRR